MAEHITRADGVYSVPARICDAVEPPAMPRLTSRTMNGPDLLPDFDKIRKHLATEGRFSEAGAIDLLERTRDVMAEEPNVVEIEAPVNIVGDLHGQFFDLLQLIEMVGTPEEANFVFLGDYVDRGIYSTEIVLLLAAMKLKWKDNVVLLRGNHESRTMTEFHNFKTEVLYKYSQAVYDAFCAMFDVIPIAALAKGESGTFLCVHGGISPDLPTIASINELDRFKEVPAKGPMCDLLWSDPIDEDTADGLKGKALDRWCGIDFLRNSTRGCSYIYGPASVKTFLAENDLVGIIRAHEVQEHGFKESFYFEEDREFPMVTTVFSAPNYCGRYGNLAAVLRYDGDGCRMIRYDEAENPFGLPDFLDAFTWSFPFIVEKVSQFFYGVLKLAENESDSEDETDSEEGVETGDEVDNNGEEPAKPPEVERTRRPSVNPEGDVVGTDKSHADDVANAMGEPKDAIAGPSSGEAKTETGGEVAAGGGVGGGFRARGKRVKTRKRPKDLRLRSRSNVVNEMFRSRGSSVNSMMRKAEIERKKNEAALLRVEIEDPVDENMTKFEAAKQADMINEMKRPLQRHFTL